MSEQAGARSSDDAAPPQSSDNDSNNEKKNDKNNDTSGRPCSKSGKVTNPNPKAAKKKLCPEHMKLMDNLRCEIKNVDPEWSQELQEMMNDPADLLKVMEAFEEHCKAADVAFDKKASSSSSS